MNDVFAESIPGKKYNVKKELTDNRVENLQWIRVVQ
jgi:hypothetical protein